ncbi:MAG: DNA repair protein RecO [Immundisolibacterales bacterium]|nr:DNA repair protein RecO [Immundisolibacterales bacterium]
MIRRVDNSPGYVLHSRPWRETSLIVEAFTREHGRVGLVARGVRRARSQFRGLLLPFRLLLVSWSGRGELPTLTGADAEGPVRSLGGRALFSGFYLNELLMKMLPRDDPHPELFDDYRRAVADLGSDGALDAVLRTFEKRLLDALGYGPALDRAADTGAPVTPDQRYRYVPERGPVEGSSAGEGVLVSGRTLLALAAGRIAGENEPARTEARRLMRVILAPHLGPHPLGSRQLFRRPGPADLENTEEAR